MNNPRAINLEDLRHLYLENDPRAKRAVDTLREVRAGSSPVRLDHLLRDHTVAAVSREETYLRDAFDFLLADYSVLEIACQIRYVPEPLPDDVTQAVSRDLSEPALRRYYEEYYPVLLPQLMRGRLAGELRLYEDQPAEPPANDNRSAEFLAQVTSLRDTAPEQSAKQLTEELQRYLHQQAETAPADRLFREFLGLVNRQREDEGLETFLWFLDDGTSGGYSITNTLAVLRKPEKLVYRVLKPEPKRDPLDLSVRGLLNFVAFCVDFDDLLQRSARFPLFQSAQWHYYAYWFECVREKVGRRVREAVQGILHWSPKKEDVQAAQAKQAIDEYVRKVEAVLDRLLSDQYGKALRDRSKVGVSPSTLETQIEKTIENALYILKLSQQQPEGELLVDLVMNQLLKEGQQVDRLQVRELIYKKLSGPRPPVESSTDWLWTWINKMRAEKGLPPL